MEDAQSVQEAKNDVVNPADFLSNIWQDNLQLHPNPPWVEGFIKRIIKSGLT